MARARRRANLTIADYIEHVLSVKVWSQAELARRCEVPVSRINVLLHGKTRKGRYGEGYQSVAVPFLYEIEEVSDVRLMIAAADTKPQQPKLTLVKSRD